MQSKIKKLLEKSIETKPEQFFMNPPEKGQSQNKAKQRGSSKIKAKPKKTNPAEQPQFKPLDIEQWWLDCMRATRSIELSHEQKVDVSLVSYPKNTKFERLVNLSILEREKPNIIAKAGEIFYKNLESSLDKFSIMRNMAQLGMVQMSEDSGSLITLGHEVIKAPEKVEENINNSQESGDFGNIEDRANIKADIKTQQDEEKDLSFFKNLQDPEKRFKFIFLHEMGHIFQLKEAAAIDGVPMVEEKKDSERNGDKREAFYFYYEGINPNQDRLLLEIIKDNTKYFNADGELPETIYQDLNHTYKQLAKEMFADCFSVLMYSKAMGTNMDELVSAIMNQRLSQSFGCAVLDTGAWEYSDVRGLDQTWAHNSTLALLRMQTLLKERDIDAQHMDFRAVYNLCQECMNYGVVQFMYECTLTNSKYKDYLDKFSIDRVQLELFGNIKDNNSYKVENLFDCLSTQDKKESCIYVDNYKKYKQEIEQQYLESQKDNAKTSNQIESAFEHLEHKKKMAFAAIKKANEHRWGVYLKPLNDIAGLEQEGSTSSREFEKEKMQQKSNPQQISLLNKINSGRDRDSRTGAQITVLNKHNKKIKVVLPKVYKSL